ncbi:ribbon-helix-helix domain-containing protein [Nitrosospira multiformis]|uniref:Antitoxin ParD1/3/4 n=1 Tax=Nitrosospira multiformis TaxID=1231 RepID=A0A1I7I5E6_9PROT|nr:type II toxin-antitoxin system ParD family antitoxin [Nitrosospira multiformis]SFU68141.1 antitoxin ParD1/3/4 [Nitrosospira multiformis]
MISEDPLSGDQLTELERLTITLTAELSDTIKAAVNEGDYASASEVIREALREWKLRRELRQEELAALKADIDQALNEVAAGRLSEFNRDRIVERVRKLLAARKRAG